ncbi:hypothetical protein SAMD00019534_024850 [Acytostelium subglobosum LB1]|uniref:hypothetical protein n=1 Tax=Acytostelium subglobosum LB1 TaxID=1410327 RepID=UPI0006447B50|nr:hypothetical protein SAMD00019534_024850 [Acytostelium subglobosum LB1]GAM19310.1 hypothetical protein SAMD00019534_024850 [Acytostelium subglobosum LB1]|eukprot:XP_012757237.1 hypothetical protein SAMD00019534_024850 [Acytostelium subglobosum LB1]
MQSFVDAQIVSLQVLDVRVPTSKDQVGSDAMHTNPDYSCAYVILKTNNDHLEGTGLTFTLGKGTDAVVQCVNAMKDLVIGKTMSQVFKDYAAFYRSLTSEPQLRWIGPEKGALHLATAAVLNAIWDLYCKCHGKPLWKVIVDMTPQQVVSLIDFRYITDALTRDEALKILTDRESTKRQREEHMLKEGFPAYTTSAGWLGYSDEKITKLCKEALEVGFTHIKIKVGNDIDDDIRRCRLIRQLIGPDRKLMVDANQRWDVDQAIQYMKRLAEFDPWWIEEPTSPDDILGHAAIAKAIAPIKVATGEMCQNRVIFKQLLQAKAMDFCQADSCRLAGPSEVITVMLMCAKFGVPVCMHAGGIGLCEYVNQLCLIDYICIAGSLENRVTEYVCHLTELFINPSVMKSSHYQCPVNPGYGCGLTPAALAEYTFPSGSYWVKECSSSNK